MKRHILAVGLALSTALLPTTAYAVPAAPEMTDPEPSPTRCGC